MQNANHIRTVRLFDEDAYRTVFHSKVLSCREDDLVLEETLFFPEEGGQSSDRGRIGTRKVLRVIIRDGEIHHLLEADDQAPAFSVGETVSGEIDFSHRFSNMQQHSAEHLFSGAAHRLFGANNVGFHLSEKEVTLDFDIPLTMEQLITVECEVNALIVRNIPSEIFFVEGERKETLAYRSKIKIDGPVRVVTFPGADSCACCAPHVRQTGEIGLVKLIDVQKHKEGVRVFILAGARAMRRLSKEHAILMGLAEDLSTSWEDLRSVANARIKESAEIKARLYRAEESLIGRQIADLPKEEKALLFLEEADPKSVRNAINSCLEDRGSIAVFIGNDRSGYHYIIASAQEDLAALQTAMTEALGARGGGRAPMIEGQLSSAREEIRDFFGARGAV